MATKKDYFCKDCYNNNNGWCPILKRNGLKDITECNDKKIKKAEINITMPKTITETEEEDILKLASKSKKINCEADSILDGLFLDIEENLSPIPGKKRITIMLKYEDKVLSDIDFDIKL